MNRPLGEIQEGVLRAFVGHNRPASERTYPDGGWLWDTPSRTTRVCNSLVKRGLLTFDLRAKQYRLTDEGKAYLTEHFNIEWR